MRCKCWPGWAIVVAGLLLPSPLSARPLIVVLPFDGAPQSRQTVIRLLRDRYEVAARRSLTTGNGPRPSAPAQTDVGQKPPDVVVSGAMQRTDTSGGWLLRLSIIHGRSGHRTDELRHMLARPMIRKADVQALAQELFPAVEKSLNWTPPREPLVAPPSALSPRMNIPLIEADFGFIIGMRRFAFDEETAPSEVRCYEHVPPPSNLMTQGRTLRYSTLPRCPGFNLAASPGLRLNLTLFPLARLSMAPLRGLGIGMTFDWMFWPVSQICDRAADGSCSTQGEALATREYRLEVGLRWRWPLPRPWPSPTLIAQYGVHHFSIQPSEANYSLRSEEGTATSVSVADNHGLPDLHYQYLDLGIGMKALYIERAHLSIGGELGLHYHLMFTHGDIEQSFTGEDQLQGGYGPIRSSYGWRLDATPMQFRWRARNSGVPGWLRAELVGYVENFRMQFQLASGDEGNSLPPLRREPEQGAKYLAQGVNDWYFGTVIQVGYEY